jgi:hypothetical protein
VTKSTNPLDLTAFLGREGRLPRLGDSRAPWAYRGWLLPYLIQLHALVPAVVDRWDECMQLYEVR